MQKSIDIEGITYVVQYRENEFIFYIDVDASKWRRRILDEYYNSMDFQFGDEPSLHLFGKTPSSHIFRIRTFVTDFIDKIIKAHQPYYFSYGANESYKIKFYTIMATYIGAKYGYRFERDRTRFQFYKQVTRD